MGPTVGDFLERCMSHVFWGVWLKIAVFSGAGKMIDGETSHLIFVDVYQGNMNIYSKT